MKDAKALLYAKLTEMELYERYSLVEFGPVEELGEHLRWIKEEICMLQRLQDDEGGDGNRRAMIRELLDLREKCVARMAAGTPSSAEGKSESLQLSLMHQCVRETVLRTVRALRGRIDDPLFIFQLSAQRSGSSETAAALRALAGEFSERVGVPLFRLQAEQELRRSVHDVICNLLKDVEADLKR